MSSAESPPVRRLWRAVLCGYLALGASLQELPGYLVARFGAGTTVVGLVVGAAFAATAVTRPFAGRAGDTGHARPVVITGGGLTALAAVGHLLAPNVGALLVFRLLMGAGEAALFSAALPWALARAAADRRGRVTGWFGLSMWGGLSVGPLLATAVHGFGGSSGVWYTVIALGSLSAALAVSAGRQMPSSGGCRSGPPRGSLRAGLLTGIGLPGLCLGLAAYGYGSLTALLVLYLTGTHYDEARG
ncbi:MAG: MFS transporter, partial [Kutzneria sp.]|nr:MFS transporter [Kutzneria sp.]